ncbi:unnamed protein product [Periconia digitata]|uniref:Uncharacterized protein n=1 Tax=Periconia digitata TaxID=1303443 RepID=A0A9W4UKA5_9PLEO|nr:unnamed protein product [Periconia digitata]
MSIGFKNDVLCKAQIKYANITSTYADAVFNGQNRAMQLGEHSRNQSCECVTARY